MWNDSSNYLRVGERSYRLRVVTPSDVPQLLDLWEASESLSPDPMNLGMTFHARCTWVAKQFARTHPGIRSAQIFVDICHVLEHARQMAKRLQGNQK